MIGVYRLGRLLELAGHRSCPPVLTFRRVSLFGSRLLSPFERIRHLSVGSTPSKGRCGSSRGSTSLCNLLKFANRNSRGVRLPFLSHEPTELVFSLPDEHKLQAGWTKHVLPEAMAVIVPGRRPAGHAEADLLK